MQTITVSVLVYDEVEVLDACGPFEVFSVANRVARRDGPGTSAPDPFLVRTVAAGSRRDVTARGGLRLSADHTLGDSPAADVVIVPGGVTSTIEKQQSLLDWIRVQRDTAEILAAVCTGAFILAEADLLAGAVTTHWEDVDDLRRRFPQLDVEDDARFIDQGAIATSAGISAGIDLSLHLVVRLAGLPTALATARQMDYPWRPQDGESRPPRAGEGLI
ncbi:DJ-1/PfpI family protein [Nocardioides sp. InS609-2]|uniref:DJ-1/PfpI family protein n=1 Tax=Nocardioides sp. InS609-2 TaxID=2760705 RepID=UPI0020BDB95C|nr:DJ-1/PfpI family protein [Nocardioides sp. InS609-2]